MLTAQRRTATATAVTDCIMFYMTSQDFDDVMSDFPSNYNEILDRALERLDTVLRSNASLEVTQVQAELITITTSTESTLAELQREAAQFDKAVDEFNAAAIR